jgi:hypothetical protein
MNRSLLILAWLGAVLVGLAAQIFLPATPIGRTLTFVAFAAAFYPLARVLWLSRTPAWRYWAGVVAGAIVAWAIDTWRAGVPSDTSYGIGIVVIALITIGFLFDVLRRRRPV